MTGNQDVGGEDFAVSARAAFIFLSPTGPTILRHEYSAADFGNAVAELGSPHLRIRVTRDRGQIFVDIAPGVGGDWFDEETVLRLVHSDDEADSLIRQGWTSIDVAAAAIGRHLPRILAAFEPANYESSARRMEQLQRQRAKRLFDR